MADNEIIEQEGAKKPQPDFPVWFDLLAVMGLFLIAKFIVSMIFIATGWVVTLPENFAEMGQEVQRALEQEVGKSTFLATIILQPLMLAFVLIYRTIRRGGWRRIRISLNGFNPTMILWGVIMLLALVVVMEPLMQLFPDAPQPDGRGAYMLLALVVAAPLFEELLCRGIILESVRMRWGAWVGCIVSAIVFGVMHQTPQGAINAFVIGLLLGYIYLKTNSIFAPLILHSLNNIFAYVMMLFGLSDRTLWELTGGGAVYTLVYGCAVAIMILSTFAMIHYLARLRKIDKAAKAAALKQGL